MQNGGECGVIIQTLRIKEEKALILKWLNQNPHLKFESDLDRIKTTFLFITLRQGKFLINI